MMCRTYVVRNEAGTSTNNITGSKYILLNPMVFCEQIEFILQYRTFFTFVQINVIAVNENVKNQISYMSN